MKIKGYNIFCLLFGHTVRADYYNVKDWLVCKKCRAHEYFDNNYYTRRWDRSALLPKLFKKLKNWLKLLRWRYEFYFSREDYLPF